MAKGTYGKTIGTIYDPAVGAPLDSRMMVPTFADLTAANTWKVDGGTSAESYAYYGMMVYVGNDPDSSKNGLYVLKASGSGTTTSDARLESCWERISQPDSKIATLQTKAISVSGITASTVETAFAEVAERLSGAATAGNLEALSNRVSTTETNIGTLSGTVGEVSGKVDINAAAILANTQSISALQKSIGEIVTFRVEVVASLPSTGEEKVIYLVEDASAAAGTYIEYIWVNGAFEQIGSTAIDLSGYALKTEVASASATAKSEAIASANGYTDGKITEVSAKITENSGLISGLRTDVDAVSGKADANATLISGLRTDVDAVSGKADANATLISGLRTDVDTVSGKADANAAAILTKAEQSAVDAVVADVQTISANVATKANADASNINSADWQTKLGYATATVVNGIDSRLTTAETNIETVSAIAKQNTADIATKASSTDLQAVSAVVKQNVADIATKASSASVTELSGKVNDNTAAIATKASSASVTELSGKVNDNTAAIAAANTAIAGKADKATTLAGYNIGDAYTKTEVDTELGKKQYKLEFYSETDTSAKIASPNSNVTVTDSGLVSLFSAGSVNISGDGGILLNHTNDTNIKLDYNGININGAVYGTAISTSIPDSEFAFNTKLPSEKAVATAISGKADKATTLAGYNIGDAYTKTETDVQITSAVNGAKSELQTAIDGKVAKTDITTTIAESSVASDTKVPSEKAVASAVEEVKAVASTAYKYKGSDTYENIIAKENPAVGDVWNSTTANGVYPKGTNYAWNGTEWDALGGEVDLSAYQVKAITVGETSTTVEAAINANKTAIDANKTAIDANKTAIGANKTAIDEHVAKQDNPHNVTAAQVGLGNVDNTSDADKPVSTAQQAALDLKQDKTDNTLATTSKTVVGAINEVKGVADAAAKADASNITVSTWKDKLGFITASEVPEQVQPDWNAGSGKGKILNKPNITKGTNGYCIIKVDGVDVSDYAYTSNGVVYYNGEYSYMSGVTLTIQALQQCSIVLETDDGGKFTSDRILGSSNVRIIKEVGMNSSPTFDFDNSTNTLSITLDYDVVTLKVFNQGE